MEVSHGSRIQLCAKAKLSKKKNSMFSSLSQLIQRG